jgi:hypothetical protein
MLSVCFWNHYHLYSFYIVQNIIMLYGQHICVRELTIFNIIIQNYISHLLHYYFIFKIQDINLFINIIFYI